MAAVALIKRGYPVQVLERDLTAIRGEGKYRGPIQVDIRNPAVGAVAANALALAIWNWGRSQLRCWPAALQAH